MHTMRTRDGRGRLVRDGAVQVIKMEDLHELEIAALSEGYTVEKKIDETGHIVTTFVKWPEEEEGDEE